jgi:hypothetical protein
MIWAHEGSDRVYRTRQIALLLSDADREAALAYALELEWEAATRSQRAHPPTVKSHHIDTGTR